MTRFDSAILVIGGLNGFVGSNACEALVELGYDCVVTRHRNTDVPRFLEESIDQHRIFVEPGDATSIADLRRIGEKHRINGIVNVAGGFKSEGQEGPTVGLTGYLSMLNAVFRVAEEWKVKRLTFASTGGMYLGISLPRVNEEQLVSIDTHFPYPILAFQKIVEISCSEFANASGTSSICARLAGMFGPCQDAGQLIPLLVHAAVTGKSPNLTNVFLGSADDANAYIYIKDLARAIAMLHTEEKLHYTVYNVGSEKVTPNSEVLAAICEVVPEFKVNLPPGHSAFPALPIMETKRLQEDTGFICKFDMRSAIRDYVEWLRKGNKK